MNLPPISPDRFRVRRRIYLVRHGEVDYFDASGRPLRTEDVPLNERGREQVTALARELGAVALDRVVHSGLRRTAESAEILVDDRDLRAESVDDLREISPGTLRDLEETTEIAGTTEADGGRPTFEAAFTGAMTRSIDRATRFLGGETFGDFHDRVAPAFRALLEDPSWRQMLVVAHGGTNRVILATALGVELAAIARLEQDPACLNIIDVAEDSEWRDACLVRLVNHTVHEAVKENLRLTTMEQIFLDYQERLAAARRDAGP